MKAKGRGVYFEGEPNNFVQDIIYMARFQLTVEPDTANVDRQVAAKEGENPQIIIA